MKIIAGLIMSLLILLTMSYPVFAKMYKWYDQKGTVHISDRFPDQAHQKGGVFLLTELDISEPSDSLPPSDLSILTSRAYRNDGQVIVVGEVRNNTLSQVKDMRLQVVSYDLSGKLFNMVWASPEPSVLGTGESGIFKTFFDDPYKVIIRVEIRLMDVTGRSKGVTSVAYVTEPQTLPRSPAVVISPENSYPPLQEVPVYQPPAIVTSAVPYTLGPTGGFVSSPLIVGFNPFFYGIPGTIILNKKVSICNRCVVPPKVPLRFDPPVHFHPRMHPKSKKSFSRKKTIQHSVKTPLISSSEQFVSPIEEKRVNWSKETVRKRR